MEIEYKFSLRSGDEFICRLNVNREGKLKYLFLQDIYRKADNKLIVTGKVTATCVNNKTGRPIIYPEFIAAFAQTQTTSPHAVFPR
jgi:acyl-CoA thioester hydrolase